MSEEGKSHKNAKGGREAAGSDFLILDLNPLAAGLTCFCTHHQFSWGINGSDLKRERGGVMAFFCRNLNLCRVNVPNEGKFSLGAPVVNCAVTLEPAVGLVITRFVRPASDVVVTALYHNNSASQMPYGKHRLVRQAEPIQLEAAKLPVLDDVA